MIPRLCALLLLALCAPATRAQLVELPGLPKEPFFSLAARGDTLLAGAVSGVYASFDAGVTWHGLGRPAAAVTSMDALILTDAGWFAGTYGHGVYHSRDAGRTWQAHRTGLTGLGSSTIMALHERAGWLYASTDGAGVFRMNLKTLDAWQRYGTEFAENEAETINALTLHEGVFVASAGGNSLVFVENPVQETWSPVQVSGQTIDFASTGSALVAISTSRCHFSLDGGGTWQRTGDGLMSGFHAALASTGSRTYATRSVAEGVSYLYRTDDPSGLWEFVAATSETLKMRVVGDRLYLAQADGLRVYPLAPVPTDPGEAPAAPLRLDAPRPNPTTALAQVAFTLDRPGPALLAAYDALGRRVGVLHDGMAPAGQTAVSWSAAALPAGLYTLRLSAAGGVAVQPLVVLR